MIESATHVVKPVLCFHDDLIEALLDRPHLLLFGEGAEMPLTSPISACPANPRVQNPPAVERYAVAQPVDQIGELGFALLTPDLVRDFERDRHDAPWIVGERRVREQDEVESTVQPADNFGRRLLSRELAKIFFDVLDLQRPLL